MDAQRNLLIQQRALTWRYSVGNNYEELSFAEALDAAQVMAGYGHGDVSRAIVRFALSRLPARYTNWRAGAVLVAAANHLALTGDRSLLGTESAAFRAVLDRLERQIDRPGGSGLLDREAFSSDVGRRVAGLHSQAVAWQGLVSMGRAWTATAHPRLAARANAAAGRLVTALRAAVRASETPLADANHPGERTRLRVQSPVRLGPMTPSSLRTSCFLDQQPDDEISSGEGAGTEARGRVCSPTLIDWPS